MNRIFKPIEHLRLLAVLALLSGTACQQVEQSDVNEQLYVFGTIVDLQITQADQTTARAAVLELESDFQRMHRDLHAWEAGLLGRVNQAIASGSAIDAGQEITDLVLRSQRAERTSRGCFNPAIGKLIGLWGFHTSEYPIIGPPPGEMAIEQLLASRPSTQDIRIEDGLLSSTNPAVQLDFGGIAKGHALDRALSILAARGINNAMVNAGGDLRVLGRNGERPWRVAIRHPSGGLIGVLEPADGEAVFTSGVYERYRQDDTTRYPHIIDPRNGQPVDQLASVTVVGADGTWADAAATALIVSGPDHWVSTATAMGLSDVLLVNGSGEIQVTPGLHQRMEYEDQMADRVRVVPLNTR